MTRLCDWNPEEDAPVNPHSHGVGSVGRWQGEPGCPNPATLVLGSRGEWRLCESCADLPRFSRFKVRLSVDEYWKRHQRPSRRVIHEAPFDEQREELRRAGEPWKICRWCGAGLTGRRTGWCSQACVDQYLIRKDPSRARKLVAHRDRGVCAECGRDTDELYRFWNRRPWQNYRNESLQPYREELHDAWRRLFEASLGLGPGARNSINIGDKGPRNAVWLGGYWDMDHITPVVEGGGGCGLSNLRTLCIPCHRGATAELAARRAAERKPQRELPLEETG
jgi:5-methylcytosine-specific restriction endonuclease McrA